MNKETLVRRLKELPPSHCATLAGAGFFIVLSVARLCGANGALVGANIGLIAVIFTTLFRHFETGRWW